jgi:LAO/AO transport system kinase
MAKQTSWFQNNRDQQAVYWLEQTIEESMKQHFYNDPVIIKELNILKKEILSGKTSPVLAANKILENYFKIQE